jgi:hypothetical protein
MFRLQPMDASTSHCLGTLERAGSANPTLMHDTLMDSHHGHKIEGLQTRNGMRKMQINMICAGYGKLQPRLLF